MLHLENKSKIASSRWKIDSYMFCLIRTLMDFGRDLLPKKGHLGAGVVSAKKRLSCRNVTQEGIHHSPLKYFTQGLVYIGYTIAQAKKLSRQL